MEQKQFTTPDVYLASFIQLSGTPPEFQRSNNGRIVFVFPGTPEIYQLISDFGNNEPVAISDYTQTLKTLRGRMLSERG